MAPLEGNWICASVRRTPRAILRWELTASVPSPDGVVLTPGWRTGARKTVLFRLAGRGPKLGCPAIVAGSHGGLLRYAGRTARRDGDPVARMEYALWRDHD